jgi:hypothetical protein
MFRDIPVRQKSQKCFAKPWRNQGRRSNATTVVNPILPRFLITTQRKNAARRKHDCYAVADSSLVRDRFAFEMGFRPMNEKKVPHWSTAWPPWYGIHGNVTVVPKEDYDFVQRDLATIKTVCAELRDHLLLVLPAIDANASPIMVRRSSDARALLRNLSVRCMNLSDQPHAQGEKR